MTAYPKIAQFKTVDAFRQRLTELQCPLPCDDRILMATDSPLAQACELGPFRLANRWVIQPMEGWDAEPDGSPSRHTLRRWFQFGVSGASLIWGGEAAAVQPDGRANPHQTMAIPGNKAGLAALLESLQAGCRERNGEGPDAVVVGLQLTHSGRFCRPHGKQLEPRIAYHHPLLDVKFGIAPDNDQVVWTDTELELLIDNYVVAAKLAADVGFQFVDVKACHGYLLHEFLSARTRPGRFGGDLEGRTRVLRSIVERIRGEVPALQVVVRLSVFDTLPYRAGNPSDADNLSEADNLSAADNQVGRPMEWQGAEYPYAFGVDLHDPRQLDLAEPIELIRRLQSWGVIGVNLSCGSPYYNPHAQRPAIFPPSDGYRPPEDPLVGVARQLTAARQCKLAVPTMPMVGTGYTYLQDYLPHVAQAVVREGWIDLVGLGRVVLSYPELPRDVLERGQLQRKKICRTFSDCTTAPRNGLISGCFPLDPYYKALDEAEQLRRLKGGT